MNRQFLRTWLYVLVVSQLFMGGLTALAWAQVAQPVLEAGTAHNHCADLEPAAGDADPCPCCPDSPGGMDCSTTCLATPAATSALAMVVPRYADFAPRAETRGGLLALADPPLKPPPIV